MLLGRLAESFINNVGLRMKLQPLKTKQLCLAFFHSLIPNIFTRLITKITKPLNAQLNNKLWQRKIRHVSEFDKIHHQLLYV